MLPHPKTFLYVDAIKNIMDANLVSVYWEFKVEMCDHVMKTIVL